MRAGERGLTAAARRAAESLARLTHLAAPAAPAAPALAEATQAVATAAAALAAQTAAAVAAHVQLTQAQARVTTAAGAAAQAAAAAATAEQTAARTPTQEAVAQRRTQVAEAAEAEAARRRAYLAAGAFGVNYGVSHGGAVQAEPTDGRLPAYPPAPLGGLPCHFVAWCTKPLQRRGDALPLFHVAADEPPPAVLALSPAEAAAARTGRRNEAEALTLEARTTLALLLFRHGVESRVVDNAGALRIPYEDADDEELVRRVRQLRDRGRAGLPRRFFGQRTYLGGGLQDFLGDSSDFLRFVRFIALSVHAFFGKQVLSDARLGLDNASTHAAVGVVTPKAGYLHDYIRSTCEMGGAVFIPSNMPSADPMETVINYMKRHLRALPLPARGLFQPVDMVGHVHDALRHVQAAHLLSWYQASCYGFRSPLALGLDVKRYELVGAVFLDMVSREPVTRLWRKPHCASCAAPPRAPPPVPQGTDLAALEARLRGTRQAATLAAVVRLVYQLDPGVAAGRAGSVWLSGPAATEAANAAARAASERRLECERVARTAEQAETAAKGAADAALEVTERSARRGMEVGTAALLRAREAYQAAQTAHQHAAAAVVGAQATEAAAQASATAASAVIPAAPDAAELEAAHGAALRFVVLARLGALSLGLQAAALQRAVAAIGSVATAAQVVRGARQYVVALEPGYAASFAPWPWSAPAPTAPAPAPAAPAPAAPVAADMQGAVEVATAVVADCQKRFAAPDA